jgi:hypothetical protein
MEGRKEGEREREGREREEWREGRKEKERATFQMLLVGSPDTVYVDGSCTDIFYLIITP